MSTPRDPDEILAAWLDMGPTALPDQTRRAILVALPTTTRRRSNHDRPWRHEPMNLFAKVALGAVAIVVIAAGGLFFFNPGASPGDVGGPTTAPSTAPSTAPTPSPSAAAGPVEAVATATGDACTLTGLGDPLPADAGAMLTVVNDTDVVVLFQTTWALPDHTFADVQAYFVAEHERALAGETLQGQPTMAQGGALREVQPGSTGEFLQPTTPGTYGIACVHHDGQSIAIDAYLTEPFEVVAAP